MHAYNRELHVNALRINKAYLIVLIIFYLNVRGVIIYLYTNCLEVGWYKEGSAVMCSYPTSIV